MLSGGGGEAQRCEMAIVFIARLLALDLAILRLYVHLYILILISSKTVLTSKRI